MGCEWGHDDCKNEGVKCYLCISRDFHYDPATVKKPKPMSKRRAKITSRQGSGFEYKNHVKNNDLLSGTLSRQTPNSGAGFIKGDEEITGIIEIMEELKTRVKEQAPGKKNFTIRKEWLDKLRREAKQAGKEFYYLKFSFHEDDSDVYVIIEEDVIMGMVYTMAEDRKEVKLAKQKEEVLMKELRMKEAEIVKLQAEIEYLKAKLELQEMKNDRARQGK